MGKEAQLLFLVQDQQFGSKALQSVMPVTVEFYFECVVRIILYFTLTLSPKHTVWTDQETHVHVSGDSVVGVCKPSV